MSHRLAELGLVEAPLNLGIGQILRRFIRRIIWWSAERTMTTRAPCLPEAPPAGSDRRARAGKALEVIGECACVFEPAIEHATIAGDGQQAAVADALDERRRVVVPQHAIAKIARRFREELRVWPVSVPVGAVTPRAVASI